jgi:hypothetical protein
MHKWLGFQPKFLEEQGCLIDRQEVLKKLRSKTKGAALLKLQQDGTDSWGQKN